MSDQISLSLSPSAFAGTADDLQFWTGAEGNLLHLALSHTTATPGGADVERWTGKAVVPPREQLAGTPTGLLCNFMNVAPEALEEFNDWYNEEHIPRLSAVPGVLSAARYHNVQVGASRPYLAIYRLETPVVQASAAWKAAAGTPWTVRMRKFARDFRRLLFVPA